MHGTSCFEILLSTTWTIHEALEALLQIQQVVPDSMLLQLLVAWLSPDSKALSLAATHTIEIKNVRPWKEGMPPEKPGCCMEAMGLNPMGCPLAMPSSKALKDGSKVSEDHAPLKVSPGCAAQTPLLLLKNPRSKFCCLPLILHFGVGDDPGPQLLAACAFVGRVQHFPDCQHAIHSSPPMRVRRPPSQAKPARERWRQELLG